MKVSIWTVVGQKEKKSKVRFEDTMRKKMCTRNEYYLTRFKRAKQRFFEKCSSFNSLENTEKLIKICIGWKRAESKLV